MEEFEAHHAHSRPEGDVTEPIEVEVEAIEDVEIIEPGSEGQGDARGDPATDAEPPGPDLADADPVGATGEAAADGDPVAQGLHEAEEEGQESSRDVVHFDDPTEMLPALARVAAELWVRATIWGIETSLRTGSRLARAAVDPQAAAELYQDVAGGLRAYAREFLGISDLDEQIRQLTPLAGATLPQNGQDPEATLRERGARLLRQAADVSFEDGVHPAYARILTELAPDEARILRTLATAGPQPMVDIRETNLIGMGSQLIASGLNMIGAQSGLRHRDRVEAYLGNLLRLGLIELSDDAVEDAIAYQVLEAQPEVLDTIKETPRAKSVHRSIRLTPFGEGFCRVCLPLEPAPSLGPGPSGEGSDAATSS